MMLRRIGKREESSRQKKISDDSQYYDKWTVGRYEKEDWEEVGVENAWFSLKDLPLGWTLWLIDMSTLSVHVPNLTLPSRQCLTLQEKHMETQEVKVGSPFPANLSSDIPQVIFLYLGDLKMTWREHGQLARWRRWSTCDVGEAF